MKQNTGKRAGRNPPQSCARRSIRAARGSLLLPGALLMAMGAKLLAPFMFVDFGFAPFFQ
jgi:hypothetical protein